MRAAVVGIPSNPVATNVPEALVSCCLARGQPYRVVDLPSVAAVIGRSGRVYDRHGPVDVTHLAPPLLYWQPQAVHALSCMAHDGVAMLNPIEGVLTADDKGATAARLAAAGIPQLTTVVCAQDAEAIREAAGAVGFPVVVKRTHGAQGRWVRFAADDRALLEAVRDLAVEGPGAFVVQPLIVEAMGQSVRVIVTAGVVRAATLRRGGPGEWRSNVTRGGSQDRTDLDEDEERISVDAAAALGLGHAGVDLLRTSNGPVVLEVNACPDFTSMAPHTGIDLADAVVATTLACRP
jgi:ribosomal protein S6--L-glutamate ligase